MRAGNERNSRSGGQHPLVVRYLDQLAAELAASKTPDEEIREIVLDIENHFNEAIASGRGLDEVIESLGAIDELAHAYTVALALGVHVEGDGARALGNRWLRRILDVSMLTAAASLAVLMTALGATLVFGGALGALAAVFLPFVPSTFLDPTLRFGLPQLVVFFLSMLCLLVGWLSLRLVRVKLRSLAIGVRALRSSGTRPRGPESSEGESTNHPAHSTTPDESSPLRPVARPTIDTWRKTDS